MDNLFCWGIYRIIFIVFGPLFHLVQLVEDLIKCMFCFINLQLANPLLFYNTDMSFIKSFCKWLNRPFAFCILVSFWSIILVGVMEGFWILTQWLLYFTIAVAFPAFGSIKTHYPNQNTRALGNCACSIIARLNALQRPREGGAFNGVLANFFRCKMAWNCSVVSKSAVRYCFL